MSDVWVVEEDGPARGRGPSRGERATLIDYLRVYRLTLELKCDGLTPEQLATRSVPPSTMSLLGLVRHLAAVEQSWFRRVMDRDLELPRLYGKLEHRDADFDGAVGTQECVDEAFTDVAPGDRLRAGVGRAVPRASTSSVCTRTVSSSCATSWCT